MRELISLIIYLSFFSLLVTILKIGILTPPPPPKNAHTVPIPPWFYLVLFVCLSYRNTNLCYRLNTLFHEITYFVAFLQKIGNLTLFWPLFGTAIPPITDKYILIIYTNNWFDYTLQRKT